MAKKLPGIPVYNAGDITWVKDVRPMMGLTEHSDLTRNLAPGQKWMTRIYADACDVGFMVVGRRVLLFTLTNIIKDATGEDVASWIFRNDEMDIELTVWND
jgi:hypothetical protein